MMTFREHKAFRLGAAPLLIVAVFIASCSSPSLPSLPGVSPPGEDEEIRISREFRREARKHLKFVNHPEVERYVDRIGRRILGATGPQSFEYRFFVVEDGQLNAFAVPGGSIYLFSGLIERAKSTDELAGVLGHEIVHVKGRHMARSSGPDAISVLSLLGMVLLARSGNGAQAAGMVGQAVAATRQAAYSRQLEMEADTLGARYMTAAGFDPKGAIAFLKTLDQERALNPIDVPAYIMSHPITQERVANAELVVKSLGPKQPRPESPETLKRVQTIIRMDRPDRNNVVAELEKSARQDARNPERLHLLGFAQQLQGNLAEARKNLEHAVTLGKRRVRAWNALGVAWLRLGEPRKAIGCWQTALELNPEQYDALYNIGRVSGQIGDWKTARQALESFVKVAPPKQYARDLAEVRGALSDMSRRGL